jgi:hypothetical protein
MRAVLVAGLITLGGPAMAAEVTRSIEIDAAPGRVWQTMGAFCSIADWHPVIAKCEEERIGGEPHRRLTTLDGGVLIEKLLSHDVDGMSYSYAIIESPLPVSNYESTIRVSEQGGKAVVTWRSTFEPKGTSEAEAVTVITGIYDAGLEKLKATVQP